MQFLVDLWLPILVSGAFVFIASSLHHMVLQIHKNDFSKLPDEEGLLAAMRDHGVRPGAYFFPHCGSMKEMGSAETKAKFQEGPVGVLLVRPSGMMNMGKPLLQWFLFTLLVGVIVAYLTAFTLPKGTRFVDVFRVAGTAAFLGYAVYALQDSIWKGQRWGVTFKFFLDGFAYALITGATFGWLWPA
jgi:hypothetical protein